MLSVYHNHISGVVVHTNILYIHRQCRRSRIVFNSDVETGDIVLLLVVESPRRLKSVRMCAGLYLHMCDLRFQSYRVSLFVRRWYGTACCAMRR